MRHAPILRPSMTLPNALKKRSMMMIAVRANLRPISAQTITLPVGVRYVMKVIILLPTNKYAPTSNLLKTILSITVATATPWSSRQPTPPTIPCSASTLSPEMISNMAHMWTPSTLQALLVYKRAVTYHCAQKVPTLCFKCRQSLQFSFSSHTLLCESAKNHFLLHQLKKQL